MSVNGDRGRVPSRQRLAQPEPGANFDDGALGVLLPPPVGMLPPEQGPPGDQPQAGPLFGLAAELAGQAPPAAPLQQGFHPAGGLLAARPPAARLGPARGPPPPVDPFSLADAARRNPRHAQQLPGGPDPGQVPYGLALELLNGANSDPSSFLNPTSAAAAADRADRAAARGARRALAPALQGVARIGVPAYDGSLSAAAAADPFFAAGGGGGRPFSAAGAGMLIPLPQALQHPPLDPFTVMELAASAEGLPEPDYGLVAELRNRAPPDPFASDFGLAAEVARRRSRSPSPLARGAGRLPAVRARRRLDPALGPGEADLADMIAERQRQAAADMAEPFSAAQRNGGQDDPFALADEQLKVPREMLYPYEPSQQEMPGEHERLKSGGGAADGVSDDEELYGLARELGVDPETARRIRQERLARGLDAYGKPLPQAEQAEPPGHKYVYDEDTGMLITTEGGQGDGGRVARQYIEDEVTGVFYKLHSKRRRLFAWLRRKEPALLDDEEEDVKGFRGGLKRTLEMLTNIFNVLGMFAQGLLAGFALLNFFMTYLLYNSSDMRDFLAYYGPLAQPANRVYYTLLVLSVISSTSRLARDKLRDFEPRSLWLAPVGYGQMLLYVAAYVLSTICTPLDDELTYEYNRNPRFYQLTFSSGFKKRLATWNALNILRTVFVGIAWVLTCYQTSPKVFDATLRAELRAMRRHTAALARGAGGPAGAALLAGQERMQRKAA